MARTQKAGMTRRNLGRTAKKVKITKTVAVKPLKDQTRAGVLAVVRKMLARNLENKLIGYKVEENVQHNSAISGADCEPLIPEIVPIDSASGNTSTQRIGDRVKPKSLMVKGMLSLQPDTSSTAQPIYVRVVIASQKTIKVGSQVLGGGVDTARLLRPGFPGVGADQVPFDGNTAELNYPINKDLFRVYYDKVHRLGSGAHVALFPDAPFPDYAKRWSYRFKELPASLTWDEGNGDWANNFAPFVAIGYAYSDGTSPDVITTRLISNTTSFFEFEDA